MKGLKYAGMLIGVGMLAGCASPMPIGALYTELKLPVTATSNSGKKMGTSECKSIMALVAMGDCSIETAKKNGGITKVSGADWEAKSILGIVGEYKLHVYGE
jgi:hypothetical protein